LIYIILYGLKNLIIFVGSELKQSLHHKYVQD